MPLEPATDPNNETPSDYLNQFLNLISQLRGGVSRYLPLLVAKVSENLPSMAPVPPIDPMHMSIKQGYAGASDNIPTPTPPDGTQFTFTTPGGPMGQFEATPGAGLLQGGPNSHAQQQAYGDRGGLMFASYSPSIQENEVNITSSPLGTPPRYLGSTGHDGQMHGPQIVAPVPRSVPMGLGGIKFEGYPG